MRVPQRSDGKGSLRWIQRLTTADPRTLAEVLGRQAGGSGGRFTWLSPLPDDEWAEYRDGDFLDRVGHPELRQQLKEYWPSRGPQWDGLGKLDDGTIVLIEAKANIPELRSSCGASPRPREKIAAALRDTAASLGGAVTAAWTDGYYQYANRLAHLHFLHDAGVPAQLLFVYFIGDADVGGPVSANVLMQALEEMYGALGLTATPIGVANAFVDVEALAPLSSSRCHDK